VRENANPDYVGRFSAEWWRKGKDSSTGIDIAGKKFFEADITKGEAALSGKPFVPTEDIPVNAITQPGLEADAKRKQFSVGHRAKQGGKTYEYDGSNWNLVE